MAGQEPRSVDDPTASSSHKNVVTTFSDVFERIIRRIDVAVTTVREFLERINSAEMGTTSTENQREERIRDFATRADCLKNELETVQRSFLMNETYLGKRIGLKNIGRESYFKLKAELEALDRTALAANVTARNLVTEYYQVKLTLPPASAPPEMFAISARQWTDAVKVDADVTNLAAENDPYFQALDSLSAPSGHANLAYSEVEGHPGLTQSLEEVAQPIEADNQGTDPGDTNLSNRAPGNDSSMAQTADGVRRLTIPIGAEMTTKLFVDLQIEGDFRLSSTSLAALIESIRNGEIKQPVLLADVNKLFK